MEDDGLTRFEKRQMEKERLDRLASLTKEKRYEEYSKMHRDRLYDLKEKQKKLKLDGDESGGEIDHVEENIHLTSKIHKIRDIQLFYRNYVKADTTT